MSSVLLGAPVGTWRPSAIICHELGRHSELLKGSRHHLTASRADVMLDGGVHEVDDVSKHAARAMSSTLPLPKECASALNTDCAHTSTAPMPLNAVDTVTCLTASLRASHSSSTLSPKQDRQCSTQRNPSIRQRTGPTCVGVRRGIVTRDAHGGRQRSEACVA
eukprot:6700605-Pyramimonas_sp.AAC.1